MYPPHWSNGSLSDIAKNEVQLQFFTLFGSEAGLMTILFLATFLTFPAHAKYPPSVAESKKRQLQNDIISTTQTKGLEESYFQKLLQLLKTSKWIYIMIASGIMHGVNLTMVTLLNPILKPTFADQSVC